MKNFFNKTGIWILAAAVVIVLTLSILSATGTGLLNNIAGTIASPFRSAGAAIGNWFGSISDKFDSVEALQKENEELRKRVAQLEDANRQAETDSQENERLRSLLNLRQQRRDFTFESAKVTQYENSNWASTLTLNRGTSSGVAVNNCVVNETGALEQMFRSNGFTIVQEGEPADVFVVNSCTVTNFGDQKSRKWLRRAKRENPGAVTVLTGCYPQAFPEEAAQFMEADLVCGNGDRKAILDNVLKLLDGHERIVAVTPHQRGELFEELPVERFETHTRAFIKVEDGCNRQCAYCVIPRARGPVRSRAEDSILKELRQLAASGYREVVLSAISLPSYGLDTGTNLVELVEKCAQVEGIERIRLGSLDPDMLTPEFITRLAAVKKLCPQFHLSLQSGCTSTLRRMRRVYTAEQYAQVVDQIRAAYGERPVSFTTDCICGFPGETQADFEESCAFLKKIGFLKVHVFPYSRRSGTPAYDFPAQVHEREKQARSREMNALAEEIRREVLAAHVGTEDEVLLETPLSETLFTGYTRLYIPVVVSAPGHVSGEIVHVRLGEYDGERVRAALC